MQELRLAVRLMRKSPAFTAVAVLALALGIGANAAMFSVANALLIRPLPYPDSDRIGIIWEKSTGQGWNRINPSGPNYLDYRDQSKTLEQVSLFEPGSGTVTGFGEPQQVPGLRVTTNFLSMLGIRPMLGRDFLPGESFQNRVVIVGHKSWMRWFGGDPKAVGRRVIADNLPYTIIGVLPPGVWMPVPAEVFVPWADADLKQQHRMSHRFAVLGRLKAGSSWDQASSELNAIEQSIAAIEPRMKDWGAYIVPLRDWMTQGSRTGALVLLAAVGLVLLIACANLANLMLARAASREREMAIRGALGASRGRIVKQLLMEALVLGVAGGIAGLVIAAWGVGILDNLLPERMRAPDSNAELIRPRIVIDSVVLLFTAFLSLATSIVFGIAPAVSASKADVNEALKEGGRNSGSTRARGVRDLLVVSEVALALVLLIAASLTIKSFWRMQQVNPGFSPSQLLVMDTELPTDAKYRTDAEQYNFYRRVLEAVGQLPGTSAAGITCSLPFGEEDHKNDFEIEGRALPPSGQLLPANYRSVSEGYFPAMQIPLKKGRLLAESDTAERPLVAVIDEAMARRYWPDAREDPIGRRIRIRNRAIEIVGVVGEVRNTGLDKAPEPTIYVSYRQDPEPRVSIVVRHPNPRGVINTVKQALYSVDRDQPVFNIRTMDEAVAGSNASSRLQLGVLAGFAVVALALASIGIYGVMSYSVAQRKSEIGLRIALGAGRSEVIRLIVGRGATLAAIGVAIGIAGGFAGAKLLATVLYGVSASDPLIFTGAAAVLGAVALIASYLPALRAARTDPLVALRHQ